MGVRFPSAQSTAIVTTVLTLTTEAVCFTTPPINLTYDGAVVYLFSYIAGGTGVGNTNLTPRFRRGTSTTSTLISGAANVVFGASVSYAVTFCYFDAPGIAANLQYSATIQQVGATGNGSVVDGAIIALLL